MNDTINGYPIIASWLTPARTTDLPGRLIVVDRGARHEERYVVAWQASVADGGGGRRWARQWDAAAYCLDLAEAARVFAKQIEREVSR